jgi:ribosome-associated translation inhibitor RaiA
LKDRMIGQPSDLVDPAQEDTKETMEELPPSRAKPPHPCHIVFKGMDPSEAARVEVRAWLERLGPLTSPMTGGQVVIEAVDEGRREDRRYHVRMELTLPEGLVVVGPEHPSNGAHEDVYVAIRNAFRAARRQLEISAQARPLVVAEIAAPLPLVPEGRSVDGFEAAPGVAE